MHQGSCLCGGVSFRVTASVEQITLCHCKMCQKAQGSAFAANAQIAQGQFELLSGRELICEYASTSNKMRTFCRRCGSPLYSYRTDSPGVLRLRIGLLDDPPMNSKRFHIFYGSRAPWFVVCDNDEKFDEFEPGRF